MKTLVRTSLLFCICFLAAGLSRSDVKYRTFSQVELAEKKAKPGKAVSSTVTFSFKNESGVMVNDFHARLNSGVISILNNGGIANLAATGKGKDLSGSGFSLASGDSITVVVLLARKAPGAKADFYWTVDGSQVGQKAEEQPVSEVLTLTEPNGGNVLEHLYKKVIKRPAGLVLGIPQVPESVKAHGWMRYLSAQKKAFPHNGTPRCFDFINGSKLFVKEVKNAHVPKHNNHLLGELHALKLAIVANDSGATEPLDSTATLFGDLLFQDTVTGPFNGMTIRQIAYLADSSLTYCGAFDASFRFALDDAISRINAAFDGPYAAASFSPFVVAGSEWLGSVSFLHSNPGIAPTTRQRSQYALDIDDTNPERFALRQNYPNPFNPTTTIEFFLNEPSIVTLRIFNSLGQQVAEVLNGEIMDEGDEMIEFDASRLPSGVYYYSIITQGLDSRTANRASRSMLLIK